MASPILLAAGGTGGHLFPARAVASEFIKAGYTCRLITDRRGAQRAEHWSDLAPLVLPSGTLTTSLMESMRATMRLLAGTRRALGIVGHAAAVIGFGGYPALPAALAAALRRCPLFLHEQNAVIGRANRLLLPLACELYLGFGLAHNKPVRKLSFHVTGNPVRADLASKRGEDFAPPQPGGPIRLLALGGSQGARQLDAILPRALSHLPEALRTRIEISHQCRQEDYNQAHRLYEQASITATLMPFFDNIDLLMDKAHVVIARAGASTLAEIALLGKPSLLMPFPGARDDHQRYNARPFLEAGAALIPGDGSLAWTRSLRDLLSSPEKLESMAKAARGLGKPQAAQAVVERVLAFIGK